MWRQAKSVADSGAASPKGHEVRNKLWRNLKKMEFTLNPISRQSMLTFWCMFFQTFFHVLWYFSLASGILSIFWYIRLSAVTSGYFFMSLNNDHMYTEIDRFIKNEIDSLY